VGSRVFGDHVGVHLDLRNVGDPVEREGLADSHLPTPDVRDVTRPIRDPLFVYNLKVLERPTVRKKVEEATGGRAVYTRSRPIVSSWVNMRVPSTVTLRIVRSNMSRTFLTPVPVMVEARVPVLRRVPSYLSSTAVSLKVKLYPCALEEAPSL
jgi:hypothetical protein